MPASASVRRARLLGGVLAGAVMAMSAGAQGGAAAPAGEPAGGSAGRPMAGAATGLEPAFRLAVGGLPLAPPVLDEGRGASPDGGSGLYGAPGLVGPPGPAPAAAEPGSTPPTLWYLSADRNLYALSEGGSLRARIKLDRPAPFLGLDAAGRPLVIEGSRLRALTRAGREAWSYELGPASGAAGEAAGAAAASAAPASSAMAAAGAAPELLVGSDGRLFLLRGTRLLCLNRSGRRLWELELPSAPLLAPKLDGAGRILLALPAGTLLRVGPFGEPEGEYRAEGELAAISAGPDPDSVLVGLAEGRLLLLKAQGSSLVPLAERSAPAGFSGWADLAAESAATMPPAGGSGAAGAGGPSPGPASIYALSRGGRLEVLDAALRPLRGADTGLASGRIRLYASRIVLTEQGRALSLDRALTVWRDARIRNAAAAPLPAPGGLLFSPGEDWILAVWRFEEGLGPLARSGAAAYPRPAEPLAELLAYDPEALVPGRAYSLLVEVEKSLESGRIGRNEPRAAGLAAAFALGMLEGNYPAPERRFRSDPLSRATACRVLGKIGSTLDLPVLLEALRLESDPAVRAAACQALGEIGADPGGSVGAAFVALTEGAAALDEQVGLALLSALEGMALRSGTPPGTEAVRAILRLASPPNGRAVRDRATRALGRIAGLFGPDRADGL